MNTMQTGSPRWTRFELLRPETRPARTSPTSFRPRRARKTGTPIQTGYPAEILLEPLRPSIFVFSEFEREILRERTRAGPAQARLNGKRLGRPATAALHTAEIRKLHRAGVSKAEIARRLGVGRTSVRRILGDSSQK